MITTQQFNSLPLLLRRRQVMACGFSDWTLRWLTNEARVKCCLPIPGGRRLFLRSSLAPLLCLPVDWDPFNAMPALLQRYQMLELGFHDEDLLALARGHGLMTLPGHGVTRYYKAEVALMVGHPWAQAEQSVTAKLQSKILEKQPQTTP